MNFIRQLSQQLESRTIRGTTGTHQLINIRTLLATVHQVTEMELPQYAENVISKFNLYSYTVHYL